LSFVFHFTSITVLKMFSNTFFYVHNIKVTEEEIDHPISKLPENISLNPIIGQTKTKKLLLTRLKPNTMSLYSDTTSYNSLPEISGGATSLSTLPTKMFLFFLYL